MSIFSETMANVPIHIPNRKVESVTEEQNNVLRENEHAQEIPQHNLLRYRFGLTKITSKKSHKQLKRKKKNKKGK